jgi:hypothetical protein
VQKILPTISRVKSTYNRRKDMNQTIVDDIHDCILCGDPINHDVQINIVSCEWDVYWYTKAYEVIYEILFPNGEVIKDSTHLLEPIAIGVYKSNTYA